MKIRVNFFCFFVLLAALGCDFHGPTRTARKDTLISVGDSLGVPRWKTLDTPLTFAGVWVLDSYLTAIAADPSPSRHPVGGPSCIEIPDSTLTATLMVYGFHDGGPTMVVVKKDHLYQFYDSELTTPGDTIEPLADGRLRIGKDVFRRLPHADTELTDWGILELTLFAGDYVREDGKPAHLGPQGWVDGLDSLLFYEPVMDYSDMDIRSVDQIRLGRKPTTLHDYGFEWKRDTLTIYRLICAKKDPDTNHCDSLGYGDVLYRLVKRK